MKRLVFLNCLFFSLFFYVFNGICGENIIVEEKLLPRLSLFPSSAKQYRSQEGFGANTLIQTPFGYKAIKKLNQGDIVIGCNGKEKRIVAITKHYVHRCVKLLINDVTIHTGYDQFYYISSSCVGVRAKNIKAGDMLLNDTHEGCLVVHAELINENKLLYYLTVEDNHIFCIAPGDVWVHNAEALVLGLSSICLGNVTLINPIVATIGATIALSAIAHKAYQSYIQQFPNNDQKSALPIDVMLAERSYYLRRLMALETIQQELFNIKNGLENLRALCFASSTSFTYQFLKQTVPLNVRKQNQLLQISATRETQLSNNQKENLRILRDRELQYLEQEIITLQTALAFHFNELIEQLYATDNEYKNDGNEIDAAIVLWNDNLDKITDFIALQLYKANLLNEYLLNNFEQKVDEFKIVADYYHNCMNAMCIRQSTNIIELLEKMNPVIKEYDQCISNEKVRVAEIAKIVEQYFTRRGISTGHIKNETKNYFQKSRNNRNAQVIAEAISKLETVVVAGSPQNNNKNNDNDK
ncbi:MAG TPA: polymorphic toxin-type HINT domain-containing protein, partial [Candidatus Babeliales bacterium]|nr:polymorphic toxin-type HINT domain-containing protein [Candidatus Babeliales bacterium]